MAPSTFSLADGHVVSWPRVLATAVHLGISSLGTYGPGSKLTLPSASLLPHCPPRTFPSCHIFQGYFAVILPHTLEFCPLSINLVLILKGHVAALPSGRENLFLLVGV